MEVKQFWITEYIAKLVVEHSITAELDVIDRLANILTRLSGDEIEIEILLVHL